MKIETYILRGWKNGLSGILLDENKEWILIKNVVGDYELDGFSLIRKKTILARSVGKWENQVKLVLKLKKTKIKSKKHLKLASLPTMLDNIVLNNELFSFQDEFEDALQIGIIEKFTKKNLHLLFIKRSGKLNSKFIWKYALKSIRVVSFDTDYLHSLKLLFEHKNRNLTTK